MTKLLFSLLFIAVMGGAKAQLIKTEHGYKGRYVTATRMLMEGSILNIKFTENKFMGMIDRTDVSDIIESNGGFILDGDYNGLNIVIFKGMDTKEKQDSVIKIVLPKIEQWYIKNK